MKLTTVPYSLQWKYKNCLVSLLRPVFEQIPTEQDFDLSVAELHFEGHPQITLDLDLFIFQISRGRDGKYFLGHEFSYGKMWCHYSLGLFENWNDLINRVRQIVAVEIQELEWRIAKQKRAIL